MPPLTDEQIVETIENSKELGESSKKMYVARLRQLRNMFDVPIRDILRKSEYYSKRINTIWKNPKTSKGYFVTLLSVFRHFPDFKEDYKADFDHYYNFFKEHDKEIDDTVNLNKPSDKQAVGYVPFTDIKAQVANLAKGTFPRLLLAVYTMIPPARADYNKVAIYRSKVPENPEPNYILITKKGMKIHMGEYKTAKHFGVINEELPKELVQEIEYSLKEVPRDWLFIGKDGEAMTANAFTKFANRWFERIFDKPLTIGILRHSFINTIDFNRTPLEERIRIAKWMGHSYVQQSKYKWVDEQYQPASE